MADSKDLKTQRRATLDTSALAAAEAGETSQYGSTDTKIDGKPAAATGRIQRRGTFAFGERLFPGKHATWTIEEDDETMGDVEIVINLLADLSPAGILPLAYGMSGTGYVPAFALLLVFAAAAAFMMYLVGLTMEKTGAKSYDMIWEKVIGPGSMWVPLATVWLVTFGCCLAYACMFGDLFAFAMPALHLGFLGRTACIMILAVFPLLPLCMLKDLSALAPTSFGALAFVVYTLVMIVIRYADGSYEPGGTYFSVAKPADTAHVTTFGVSSLLLVNALAVAFLCHYNGCKYYREFVGHRPEKFGKRVALAFTLVSLIFAGCMMLGYATFGKASDAVILNNYATNDPMATVARIGMGLANVFSFPLMFSGLRESTLSLVSFCDASMKDTCTQVWFQNMLSTIMLSLITLAAVLVTDAGIVVGLVGAICGSAIIYVIPCFLYDRAELKYGDPTAMKRKLAQVIGCVGLVLMVMGTYAALVF